MRVMFIEPKRSVYCVGGGSEVRKKGETSGD